MRIPAAAAAVGALLLGGAAACGSNGRDAADSAGGGAAPTMASSVEPTTTSSTGVAASATSSSGVAASSSTSAARAGSTTTPTARAASKPPCLAADATRPAGGWYPASGGDGAVLGDGGQLGTSAAMDRLAKQAADALGSRFSVTSSSDVTDKGCVVSRHVSLATADGGRAYVDWYQLVGARSRADEPHVGTLSFVDGGDGGTSATEAGADDHQLALVASTHGRLVRVAALGKNARSVSGWPTTFAVRPPYDPAPLTSQQLLPIAEQLVGASQG